MLKLNLKNLTLLRIEIKNKLFLKQHVEALCRKANFQTIALKQIRNYLNTESSEFHLLEFSILSTYLDVWIEN